MTGWRTWFDALGVPFKPRAQDRRFEDYNLVLAAAEESAWRWRGYRSPTPISSVANSCAWPHEVDSVLRYYFVHAKGRIGLRCWR